MEHEDDSDTNCNGALRTIPKGLVKGLGDLNTEKSPVDFRRLVVTQTPVRNHQLTLLRIRRE